MLCALSQFLDRGNNNNNNNNTAPAPGDRTDSAAISTQDKSINNSNSSVGSRNSFCTNASNIINNNNNNTTKTKDNNTSKFVFQDGGALGGNGGKDYFRHNRRHLPAPHGPYTVGSVDLMCDLSDHGAFFRMYYPTTPTDNIHAHYKQWPLWLPRKQYAWGFVLFLKRNKKIFGRLANWLGGDVYVPSLWQAPLLREDKKYPVIIVSHGIGGNRTYLSSYCTELASHGFVVAALEHRDGSASMTLCLEEQLKSSIRDSNDHYGSDYNLHDTKCKDILNNSYNGGSKNNNSNKGSSDNANNNNNESDNADAVDSSNTDNVKNKENDNDSNNIEDKQLNKENVLTDDSNKSNSPTKTTSDNHSMQSGKKPRLRKCRSAAAALREYFSDDGDNVNGESASRRKSTATASPSTKSTTSSTKDMEEAQQEIQFRSWDRRRHKRQRSLRQQESCSEEWRPFQHISVWDDFDFRNNQMYYRAHEISEVLDELVAMNGGRHLNNALGLAFKTAQFKNRLDLSRVAVIGHSFGAAAALAALNTDKRFVTGISLDGWMHPVDESVYNNTKQPTMFLNMEQFQWERNVKQILKFISCKPDTDRPLLTLLGGCHQSCTDFQFLVPHVVGRFLDVCWTLQPETCMATCVNTSLAFLYKQFGLPMEQKHVDALEGKSPHLLSGTNVNLDIPDDGPTPP